MAKLGRPWALATSYDIAFLHLVLASLEGGALETRPCTALPFKDVPVRVVTEESRRWLTAVNILLMTEKCHDDIQDENSLKGRVGLSLLERQVQRALETLATSGFEASHIQGLHRRQKRVEKADIASLEGLALPTALMLGEVFAHIAALLNRPELRPGLLHLGQGLATTIYIRDAFDDYQKDLSKGRFNAIHKALGSPWSKAKVRDIMEREWSRALLGLRLLELQDQDFQVARELLNGLRLLNSPQSQAAASLPRRTGTRGVCEILMCFDVAICCECGAGAGIEACCTSGCGCPCDCAVCCAESRKVSTPTPAPEPAPTPSLPCPACGQKLKAQSYKGYPATGLISVASSVELDECERCGGLWFDHGELETLSSFSELPERLLRRGKAWTPELRPEGTRPCPHCAEVMVGTLVKGIRIDLCTFCKGMWLDQGELNQLLED